MEQARTNVIDDRADAHDSNEGVQTGCAVKVSIQQEVQYYRGTEKRRRYHRQQCPKECTHHGLPHSDVPFRGFRRAQFHGFA
jgi:hypothetical protein